MVLVIDVVAYGSKASSLAYFGLYCGSYGRLHDCLAFSYAVAVYSSFKS